jgi:hypothetical protein
MKKRIFYCAAIVMAVCLFFSCSESEGIGSDLLSNAQTSSKDKDQRVISLVESFRKDHPSGPATKARSSEGIVVKNIRHEKLKVNIDDDLSSSVSTKSSLIGILISGKVFLSLPLI